MTPGSRLRRSSRLTAACAATAAAALLLSACGSDDGGGGGAEESDSVRGEDAPLWDALPEEIQEKGRIDVGSDIDYAPIEFINDDDEIDGIDPDIADALGNVLGVDFEFQNGGFNELVANMNAGRLDIIMSAMTDTKERQQGATDDAEGGADFVNYFQAGSAILVQQGNPESIESLADMCGMTVAVQRGTANDILAEEQSEKCDDPIEILAGDQDSQSLRELQQGRADAAITDYPVALYNALTAGGGNAFEVVGEQIDAAPYGIAVPKDKNELRDALHQAVQAIMDDGTYQEVLERWDAETGALEEATINAGE